MSNPLRRVCPECGQYAGGHFTGCPETPEHDEPESEDAFIERILQEGDENLWPIWRTDLEPTREQPSKSHP